MTALASLAALDAPLVELPRFTIEPPDKGDALEVTRQAAFRRELRLRAPLIMSWSVPNAGKRGFKAVARAKLEGLRAGVFDEHYAWNHGMAFLEWKDSRGMPSPKQIEWGNAMLDRGFCVAVVRSVDFAMALMGGWGAL